MSRQERRYLRRNQQPSDQNRCADTKSPGGFAAVGRQRHFHFLQFAQDRLCLLIDEPPLVSEGQMPGRSAKQLRAESLLESREVAAHRRKRHWNRTRGSGETACFKDPSKHPHRVKTIHRSILPLFGVVYSELSGLSRFWE